MRLTMKDLDAIYQRMHRLSIALQYLQDLDRQTTIHSASTLDRPLPLSAYGVSIADVPTLSPALPTQVLVVPCPDP